MFFGFKSPGERFPISQSKFPGDVFNLLVIQNFSGWRNSRKVGGLQKMIPMRNALLPELLFRGLADAIEEYEGGLEHEYRQGNCGEFLI